LTRMRGCQTATGDRASHQSPLTAVGVAADSTSSPSKGARRRQTKNQLKFYEGAKRNFSDMRSGNPA